MIDHTLEILNQLVEESGGTFSMTIRDGLLTISSDGYSYMLTGELTFDRLLSAHAYLTAYRLRKEGLV